MRQSFIILFTVCFLALPTALFAQDNQLQTQLQTTEFFDPTKKKVEEAYQFSTDWRVEAGYVQWDERELDTTSHYQHGLRVGATIDFNLPHRFSIQTGALATLSYGINEQHWASITAESAQVEYIKHNIVQLQLTIPVRAYYTIKLWKELNLFFYAGPQLQIGLTNYDLTSNHLSAELEQWLQSQNIPTTKHDRYVANELYRTNIQFGLGGGLEWDRYRLQAGYDFGLNNLTKTAVLLNQQSYQWGWMATFAYKL